MIFVYFLGDIKLLLAFFGKSTYNQWSVSKKCNRGCRYAGEESPDFTGQDAR